MYELIAKQQVGGSPVFQARLSGVPLGPWHPTKQLAVRDILNCGVRGEVADRTGVPPQVNGAQLGWA